jgi:hypothetical protein
MAQVQPAVVTLDIRHARRNGIPTAAEKRRANRRARHNLRIVTSILAEDPDVALHGQRSDRVYLSSWELD